MTTYREVLRPSAWMYLIAFFMVPTLILVIAPWSLVLGVIIATVFYIAAVIAIIASAPSIELTENELRVGKAHIERRFIGAASAYAGSHAVTARGTGLDARAWIFLRGWVNPVVRVDITDPQDPTPYWLFSTRHPEELVAALRQGL
jgi:hypothetical protein